MESKLTKEVYDKYSKVWEMLKEKFPSLTQFHSNGGEYYYQSKRKASELYQIKDDYSDLTNEHLYRKLFVSISESGNTIYFISSNDCTGYSQNQEIVPFNLLYVLLEDFFMDYDIVIEIDYRAYIGEKWSGRCFDLTIDDNDYIGEQLDSYCQKNEAKYQAIIKACEILEEKNGK